jgi:hypothetical protein
MEMKLKNDVFYLLENGEEKWIYDAESEAIDALKKLVSEKKELNPENVSILEVNTSGEKWEIKSVPWSKIAVGLMRGK